MVINRYSDFEDITFKTTSFLVCNRLFYWQVRLEHFLKFKEGIEKTKGEIDRLDPEDGSSEQANLNFSQKSSLWCRGEE